MAPHTTNAVNDSIISSTDHSNSKRLEILVDGYYYDVTDFISRHPGGSVINYYTEKGEDATQAIQQFHNRSTKKVQAILKSFKKRPATDLDVVMDPQKLKRHQAITKDFAELFVEIQKEGVFEASYMHVTWRFIEVFSMFYFGCVLAASPNLFIRLAGCVLLGITGGRAGYFVHDAGHKALTGIPKLDYPIQSFVYGFILGLSANWWNRNHNKHHAMPQRMHHDIDLDTMPFMAYNTKVIKDPKQGKSFWIRNQVILFMAINSFLGVTAWRVIHSPKNVIKRRNYLDLFFMCTHWLFVYYYIGFINMQIMVWVGSNYLYGNFALSHTHTPVTEESNHWVEYGLIHTVDVSHNIFVDWWMGWLNYQIEHHLFPTMPHFKAHKISGRVKALAEKHGLPYRCYSFTEAWKITLDNLRNISNHYAHQ